MHEAVFFVIQNRSFRAVCKLRAPVEYLTVSYCQRGKINCHAYEHKKQPFPFAELYVADPEYTHHNKQQQKTAADICELQSCNSLLVCGRERNKHMSEIDDRNKREDQGEMHVEVLMPQKYIYECKNDRKNEHDLVIDDCHRFTSVLFLKYTASSNVL